jgi:AmiR/NasT family two-component response regulator
VTQVSGRAGRALIGRALDGPALASLTGPAEGAGPTPALALVTRRLVESQALCRQVADLRSDLEERQAVERAKGSSCGGSRGMNGE